MKLDALSIVNTNLKIICADFHIVHLGKFVHITSHLLEVVDVELGELWYFRKSSTIVSLDLFAEIDPLNIFSNNAPPCAVHICF